MKNTHTQRTIAIIIQKVYTTLFFAFLGLSGAMGQLTGTKYIPGDYATVAIAVGALNASGPGAGGVTFNVAANYTETIGSVISLNTTGTAANPIVFQKNPATEGANPLITAYTGGVATPTSLEQNGIWRLWGSDYVTINAIDVRDNPANTTNPSTMEYGYALYKQSSSNGCQFVTIKNCTITLSNVNNASSTNPMTEGCAGILVMNASATSAIVVYGPVAGGGNTNNKFYGNLIQNCNYGISISGSTDVSPFTFADTNNDIGGTSPATGNTIINFGGALGATNPSAAIRAQNQYALNVSYNTITNNNGSGTNHTVVLRGILVNSAISAACTISHNTITLKGGGTTTNVTGIENAAGSTAAGNTVDISSNSIINSTYTNATSGNFYGIYNSGGPTTLTINNNIFSNNSTSASSSGTLYGIYNLGVASTVTLNGNVFSGNLFAGTSTGAFCGIYNSAATPGLFINGNTIAGSSTNSVSGPYYAIFNSGAVTNAININANNIGTSVSPAITFNAVNTVTCNYIYNLNGSANAVLSISNNNIQGINFSVGGAGLNNYIINSAATLSQSINGNTFTNLNVNTTGTIYFIANSVAVSGTGIQNVNNNSIVGSFTKTGSGSNSVNLFSSTKNCFQGSVINNNNNNFSNINISGATVMNGWVNTDSSTSTKTIQNNTFSNWVVGTGSVNAMNINLNGTNNATTGNVISNISGAGNVTGIGTAFGNDNIFSNSISALASTGTGAVTGILLTGGTNKNIYSNKIYDLQVNNAGGTVSGITVQGTTIIKANIYNNLIGDLKSPIANTATDVVRGMSLTATALNATINVYYNTVYLNATSTGMNFSSSGIYHTTSTTATTATLCLRNNIVTNMSVANGSGLTVAYRRSTAAFDNYASTSNNNLFYAGTPATNRLIFYNATNSDQTLSAYKTRVAARDAQSVTEDMITGSKFLSTLGSSAFFLHLDSTKATQAENGAVIIAGFTADYDAQTRQGTSGYSGTGTAPDIGADELNGTPAIAFSGTYTVGAAQAFTSLTNAGGLFASINNLSLKGNVLINITSDLSEDGSNILNQWAEQGIGNYTLTIQPDASVSRIISGNVLNGMIRLNGAKRVMIDGSNGTASNYLTFRNTNASGTTGTAFTFINEASFNTLKYCNVEAYTNATNGVILFGSSTTGGNSNNLISNCNINATVGGNTGSLCIYSAGTLGYENSMNSVISNKMYNYRDRALDITAAGSKSWTISSSSCYNGDVAGAISYPASTTLHGIRISGGAGYTITNNYIGGNAPLASGTTASYSSAGILSFHGILLTTTSALPVSFIKGNTVANVSISAVPTVVTSSNVFIGIETNGAGINMGGTLPGEGNIIGSNTLNGSIVVTTSTTNTTFLSTIKGINCNSTGGYITGNQVGGIDISNIGAAAGPSTFYGVYVNASTAPSLISNNIIGSTGVGAVPNSIRVLIGSLSTATSVTGISVAAAVTSPVQVSGNSIQNVSYQNANANGSLTGIATSISLPGSTTIINNVITGNTTNASTGQLYGIYNNGTAATVNINNNTISNNTSTAGTSGLLYGINTAGTGTSTITITNNVFSGNATGALTTGFFAGVYNTAPLKSLTVNSNSFYSNVTSSTGTGAFYAIYNSGVVTAAINLNSNKIGSATLSAITYNSANSGNQYFINNTAGTGAVNLSISNNNFQGINYAVAATSNNNLINNTANTLSQTINGNTFTNLNINTSNNVTFISNSVIVPAAGSQNINNNSITGTFIKTAGGIVTLFTNIATSVSGATINNNNNNFSNITVSGTANIAGWVNTDGAASRTIQNNTFTNWVAASGTITVLTVNVAGAGNITTGNTIQNISGANAVTGISSVSGSNNIYSNTISGLASSANILVCGISVTGGATQSIYRNKIYDLSNSVGTSSTVLVSGILVAGGATVNVYNNLVGDLRAPVANNSTIDVIRGINVSSAIASSTINVYYNTVYLNAASTGATFSTTGLYHAASAISTTATLNLRNNSISNNSIFSGAGIIAAFRRFPAAAFTNYASTSNNNHFYGGTPGIKQLIFYDGTNSDQTLGAYKTRVAARDAQSITENLSTKFLSTVGSSLVFLHLDTTQFTLLDGAAVNISGFKDDVDGQIRAGNTGYTGAGTLPDVGADEIFGTENTSPTIMYTLLANTGSTANRNVTGVNITDASGINITAGTMPRIYYKRFADANGLLDNTSTTNGWKYTEATNLATPFTFTIDYSLLFGGVAVTAGIIQYFMVAQDLATTPNVGINSGTFNAAPLSVALTSAAFPIGGTINSYNIAFSGIYNIGNSEVYTSLTKSDGLFAAINSAGIMGNTTFNITSDLAEDGTIALNQWTELGAGNYTLLIQPDAATLRTISGNAASGLVRLNGADRVTIDGSNSGSGVYLSFINTNTAGTTGTAFTFINGATNNAIRYCDAQGFANANNGVVLFSTCTVTGGNSNNLIDNCTITATVGANTGNAAIYSGGTTGNENSSNTISYNSISGYKTRGLDIGATGSSAWTILGNSFYNGNVTATINYAASSTLHGIRINGGSGYFVLNNYIGGSAVNASGSNALYSSDAGSVSYQGISLTTTSATPASNIKGNTIAGISVTSVSTAANSAPFSGIETNGSGINIGGSAIGEGNLIGAAGANGSIVITTSTTSTTNTSLIKGINCISTGGTITGNQVAGFNISNIGTAPASSAFTGVRINTPSPPSQVNNNIIGSRETSNSIQVLSMSGAAATSLTGISTGASVNSNMLFNGNMINNISHLSLTSSGSFTGISNGATSGIMTISNDTIQNITTAANATANSTVYSGIYSGTASFISNNIISNFTLYATGINAQITGVRVSGAFAHTITGNFISDLTTASAKTSTSVETGSPAASAVIGILNSATIAGQVISFNTIHDLNITNTSNINPVVTGIGITATVSGNIFNNRIAAFTNQATGTNPGICGIIAASGSFNLYNNAIKLNNATYANGVKIYGINHAAANNWNYYHNSVSIAGTASGAAMRSAAFIRPVTGSLILTNNVFVNTRAGTGLNYAISNLVSPPSAIWSSTASNNNDLFSSNANTTAEWGLANSQTFAQWKTASGGDANSVSRPVLFIASLYDLQPDNMSNCALDNAGVPITTPIVINADLNNVSRSSTSPDIGAYEFGYAMFVVSAGNNSPLCAGSQLSLTSDPGTALNPTYSWTNPNNVIISAIQNPDVATLAGTYTITITDGSGCFNTANTVVAVTPTPTATLNGPLFVCSGNSATLNVTLTGSGTISGTLSSGDIFSGTASTISVIVTPYITTSYYITTLDDANCAARPGDRSDTARVNVRQSGDWTGSLNSNWNDAGNWCGGFIPIATTNINLPGGLNNYPVLNAGIRAVQNIAIESGAALTVTGAVLQIGGSITNGGTFNAAGGSIEMNGASAQFIPATAFSTNSLQDLTINNPAGAVLGGLLKITGVLAVTSGDFNLNNNNLVLKSSATATSRVGPVTGSITNGSNVTVERYIPLGKRAYRNLAAGVNTTGNIFDNWQNSKINTPGTGTHITGSTSASNGFDGSVSGGYSLFSYMPGSAGFTPITATNGINEKLSALKGYRLFIRGDRNASLTVNNNTGTGTNNINMNAATTLKATGTLITGTVSFTKTGTSTTLGMDNSTSLGLNAGDYSLIGNPYWSPVDFDALAKTDIKPTYYIWDASIGNRGAYTSYTIGAGSSGGGAVNQYIQPGQAVFIQNSDAGTFGGNPSVAFNETNKAVVFTNTFRTPAQTPSKMVVALYEAGRLTSGGSMQDASTIAFRDDFFDKITYDDADKLINPDENIAIVSNNRLFGLEGRHSASAFHDTIPLRLWNLYAINKYVLKISASDFEDGAIAFAEDKFTSQQYPLNLSGHTIIPFEFSSDSASFYNRFRIVFRTAMPLPVNITGVKAWLKNKGVQVNWQTVTESNMAHYNVERSADGVHFDRVATVAAANNNNGFAAYEWFDAIPFKDLNYYRIQSISKNNVAGYSGIVKVKLAPAELGIKVFSNPVTTNVIQIQLNNIEKGVFQVHLFNSSGQAMVNQLFNYNGNTGIHTIMLPRQLPAGVYQLQLKNQKIKVITTLIIQ